MKDIYKFKCECFPLAVYLWFWLISLLCEDIARECAQDLSFSLDGLREHTNGVANPCLLAISCKCQQAI